MIEDNSPIFSTGKTPEVAKIEYMNLVFNLISSFGSSMADLTCEITPARVYSYSLFLLNMIPDPTKRAEIKNDFYEKRNKIYSRNDIDMTEKDNEAFRVSMDLLGEVIELFDMWIGVSHRQLVFGGNNGPM